MHDRNLSLSTNTNIHQESNGIIILYTNDVHCAIDEEDSIGYAGLADIKKHYEQTGAQVLLVDSGDAIQGGAIGAFSKGSYIIDMMNEIGYDISAVGNHEFDYGALHFEELMKQAHFPYINCNIRYMKDDSLVFAPYKILEAGGIKIGFVGITTPDTPLSSSPDDLLDENREMLYSFGREGNGTELYNEIQTAVNDARRNGADYVIALAHLGQDDTTSPWASVNVIANTTGIDVMLDGHSHDTIECEFIKNKNGDMVLLSQAGTRLSSVGVLEIGGGDIMSTELDEQIRIMSTRLISSWNGRDTAMTEFIDKIQAEFDKDLKKIIGHTDAPFLAHNYETSESIIRRSETNLGDFCADAFRMVTGADIGMDNGGGIRANINAGPITYEEVFNVKPFGNLICVLEVTGQNILDALELGASLCPEEDGRFLQVSGITYEIDTSIESSVKVDEDGNFVTVDGEYRVQNVLYGNDPLDLNRTYTLASHDYYLKYGGSGFSMFLKGTMVQNGTKMDNQVLAEYLENYLHGVIGEEYSNPYGQGRIRVK